MGHSQQDKAATHARIVDIASRRLREKGLEGIGVADLMKEAGLTHGGFYAHFASREALVIEAFGDAMDRSTERWRKALAELAPEKRLYATMFMIALAMELYGTAVGNWTWREHVRGTPFDTLNPPLAAGAFYCMLDWAVSLHIRIRQRLRGDVVPAAPATIPAG